LLTTNPHKYCYVNSFGHPLLHIPHRLYSTGLLSRTRIDVLQGFWFRHPDFEPIHCPAGLYDGFSVPKPLTIITFGMMKPLMPVIESTYPHDVVCAREMMNPKKRRELFQVAYDEAVRQFYKGKYPDRRRDHLIRGVFGGSKYFGAC